MRGKSFWRHQHDNNNQQQPQQKDPNNNNKQQQRQPTKHKQRQPVPSARASSLTLPRTQPVNAADLQATDPCAALMPTNEAQLAFDLLCRDLCAASIYVPRSTTLIVDGVAWTVLIPAVASSR